MIHAPTNLQSSFIPPILGGKDVLIRDTTGSGKTFGVLLALLSKPRRRNPIDNRPGITSVIMVPNQELAFQIDSWAQSLFPTANERQLQELIQVLVTPDAPLLPQLSLPESTIDNEMNPHRIRRANRKATSLSSFLTQASQFMIDEQVQKLSKALPHVLVATPTRLWSLLERGILDLSGIETLVLDEVDHLIRLPGRYASQKEIYNRDRHPKPGELALREIIRSAQAAGRSDQDSQRKNGSSLGHIQVIASSATMNRPMRYWLESNGLIHHPEWIDTTKSVVLPSKIEHHCVVVGAHSVRNIKRVNDDIPWNQRGMRRGNSDKEIDWADTDGAWQQDKDVAWREKQLEESGLASESETKSEKFTDDDDRMLESVAMSCMLDNVDNACVFFCSPFSLSFIARQLEHEFQLDVLQLQEAFPSSPQPDEQQQQQQHGSRRTSRPKKGIFIAHESNARGLDLPGLSHVFIVGLPSSPSSYVHMAGRTGRMGRKGKVVTIIRDDGHLEDRARSLFKTLQVNVQPFEHVQ